MPKVKLNLQGLSALEKVAKVRQLVTSLTGNANFTTPHPTLAQLTAGADGLEAAYSDAQTARQIAQTKTSILRDEEAGVEKLLRQAAAYIESVSGDDESTILSAGLDIRSTASAVIAPTAPTSLTLIDGNQEGEFNLTWDKVKGAKSYIIERSPDPPTATSWGNATVVLKASATIKGLTAGTRYWFRVASVLSSGQSGWSDPATKIAPF
ncbi:MAG TPA: fibronectin type III domain-containing protein, partial [Blastocatellia bacterium]|nr:fibronectin type III domain-containing protein [Blastocatellia bacterium]